MKIRSLSKLFLIVLFCTATPLLFGADYLYSKLQMKSYDEMLNEVKARVQKAEKEGNDDADTAKKRLKDALLLILSRPDRDNMVSQLMPTVRGPLKNLDAFEEIAREITDEAVSKIKLKSTAPDLKATCFIILENMMSELKPDAQTNAGIKSIFEKIRDAKIVVGSDVKNELRMRSSLKPPASPSEIATKILTGAK